MDEIIDYIEKEIKECHNNLEKPNYSSDLIRYRIRVFREMYHQIHSINSAAKVIDESFLYKYI